MADGSDNSLFSLLSARYGLGTALSLMSLFSPEASAAQKAFGGAQGTAQGLGGLGYLTGSPNVAALGKGLGQLAGTGAFGYNLYDIASNPNLSTGQKAGQAGIQAGELAGSLAIPYFGAGVAAKAVIDQLRRSGSPQVAATGRALGGPALPVEGLLSVIGGQQSPRAAFNSMVQNIKEVPILGKPLGKMMGFFGLGTKPTQGHQFRTELENIFGQLAPLKGLRAGKYQKPTGGYESFDPKAVTAAQQLGQILSAFTSTGKAKPQDYALQAENVLLNQYGNQMPQILAQLLPLLGPKPQTAQKKVA